MITSAAVTNTATAALSYAIDCGWYVLPLTSRGPAVPVNDSTRAERQIALLWGQFGGAGVGIDIERSGLCVVDAPARTQWGERTPALSTLQSQDGAGRCFFWYRLRGVDADPARLPMGVTIRTQGIMPAPPTYAGIDRRWKWAGRHAEAAELPNWLACARKKTPMPTPPEAAAVRRGWVTSDDALQMLDAALERVEPEVGWNRDLHEAAHLAGRLVGASLIPRTTAELLCLAAAARVGVPAPVAREQIPTILINAAADMSGELRAEFRASNDWIVFQRELDRETAALKARMGMGRSR